MAYAAGTSLAYALRDRYVLERELGRGGMATVYLARDLKHDRPVALKVLRPELAATLGPDRFRREIHLAARLQHPHILSVYDSGESAGQLWFTMPYVEGESLRSRLTREGQLPVEVALRITREAAQALQYAHEQGVIHRDIKPENLLLTRDGSALVADFGIARALNGGDERLTETGLSLGTPRYMSPEQASAERALDARTDVYSLGCVLYEMLAGEAPYTGPTAQSIMAKRFSEPVPSVRRVRPSVSEAVDLALQQALALVPADRFPTAIEFAQALQLTVATPTAVPTVGLAPVPSPAARARVSAVAPPPRSLRSRRSSLVAAIALGMGLVVGLGALFSWRRTHAAVGGREGGGPKVLAVLPFENLGDAADAYFADGVTDAVRGKLADLATLRVIASASANQYKHTPKPPQQIARELGAEYLLVGRIRWEKSRTPSRVEVSPELIDVTNAGLPTTRWQQPFDAELSDVFAVQAEIATKVAEALGIALGSQTREQLKARPTRSLAAYDAYLQAVGEGDLIVASPQRHRQMIALLERAVALDSSFAPAWAQLSLAHAYAYHQDALDPADLDAARHAAERAVRLDSLLPVARRALGDAARFERDWPAAIQQYEAGLRVAPNDADLLSSMARAAGSAGRWDEALATLQRAERIDPRSLTVLYRQYEALWVLRRYPEALEIAVREQAVGSTALLVRLDQARAQFGMGDSAAAVATFRAAVGRVTPEQAADLVVDWTTWAGYLTSAEQEVLMRAEPAAFGGDRGRWGVALATLAYLRGDARRARAYADSARIALEPRLQRGDDPALRAILARAHAFAGRKQEALNEIEAAVASVPLSRDAVEWQRLQRSAAGTQMVVGEPERAITTLESLLTVPSFASPTLLRYDPWWKPLRNNPRFEKLIAGR